MVNCLEETQGVQPLPVPVTLCQHPQEQKGLGNVTHYPGVQMRVRTDFLLRRRWTVIEIELSRSALLQVSAACVHPSVDKSPSVRLLKEKVK